MAAVLRPVGCRQGTQPAARRGVRAASGGAGDSQEEALVGVSQETGVLYFLYSHVAHVYAMASLQLCIEQGFTL